jgi:hypothetical protein
MECKQTQTCSCIICLRVQSQSLTCRHFGWTMHAVAMALEGCEVSRMSFIVSIHICIINALGGGCLITQTHWLGLP